MKKASKLVKNKGKETVLRADHNLFGLMIMVSQNRKLQMNEVLKHPLVHCLIHLQQMMVFLGRLQKLHWEEK